MESIKDQIQEYLFSEGLRPQEEDYGFFFRYQMLSYLIHWDKDDARYLKISLPSIFTVDENNRTDALEAINTVNLNRKVIKAILVDENVWITAEQLLDKSPEYKDIIPRTLDMLLQGRDIFYETMRNL